MQTKKSNSCFVFLSGCLTHIASAVVKFILEITCSTFSIKKKLLSASNFLLSLYFILNNFDFMGHVWFLPRLCDLTQWPQQLLSKLINMKCAVLKYLQHLLPAKSYIIKYYASELCMYLYVRKWISRKQLLVLRTFNIAYDLNSIIRNTVTEIGAVVYDAWSLIVIHLHTVEESGFLYNISTWAIFFYLVNPCCRITVDEKPKNNAFSISTFRGEREGIGI